VNQLQFVALICERDVLRYTPAGVPIVSATLMHSSQQVEAGVPRLAGEISGRFSQAELGAAHQFTGFLAKKNRSSKSLVFHIIDFSAAP
jgi:primosomal replication protein N